MHVMLVQPGLADHEREKRKPEAGDERRARSPRQSPGEEEHRRAVQNKAREHEHIQRGDRAEARRQAVK